jgi:hypothetical protein
MTKAVIPAKPVPAKAGSGNPGKHWIPGQARNDKLPGTFVDMWQNGREEERDERKI